MKKIFYCLLLVTFLNAQNSFARDIIIKITKIEVAAGTKDIGFSQEYGIDTFLNYFHASFLTGDADLEMNLGLGFCDENKNSKSLPDWSSRCRPIAKINQDNIMIRANPSKKSEVFMPANYIFEIPFDLKTDYIDFRPSSAVHAQGSAKNLKIYAYDSGFDDEMLAETQASTCFSDIITHKTSYCVLKATGKVNLEIQIAVSED